jgi:hypothetical protein
VQSGTQSAKVHQIGYLIYGSPPSVAHRTEALRMGLRDLGYVESTSPLYFDQPKRRIGCPNAPGGGFEMTSSEMAFERPMRRIGGDVQGLTDYGGWKGTRVSPVPFTIFAA